MNNEQTPIESSDERVRRVRTRSAHSTPAQPERGLMGVQEFIIRLRVPRA